MKKISLALTLAAFVIALVASPSLAQTTGNATLTCTPATSVIIPGQNVNFLISGGNGTYLVTGSGITPTTTTNGVFTTSFASSGPRTVTVTSGGQTTNCNVNVSSAANPVVCNSPSGAITVGQQAQFTATGGNGAFTWSASDLTISDPTGTAFNATYSTPGLHTVTVTSNGSTASCALNVLPVAAGGTTPGSSTGGGIILPTTCAPVSQTVTVGQQANWTATGGDGVNYVWSATDLQLVTPTGTGFRAMYGAPGLHTVTVTSGGRSASCSVTVLPLSGTTPTPTPTPTPNIPGLPNTGFAPVN